MIKLKFSLLFVIVSLIIINIVASQSAACEYVLSDFDRYDCQLTLKNADESTQITGQHLDEFLDEDVQAVDTDNTNSKSTLIPAGLCNRFKDLVLFSMTEIGLEEITENSFKNCQNLEFVILNKNNIKKIAKKSFANQTKLKFLWLDNNELTALEPDLFANLSSIVTLFLSKNQLQILPDGIFSPLINLQRLYLDRNEFTTLKFSWFGVAVQKLSTFCFNGNELNAIDEKIIDHNPELMKIMGHSNACVVDPTYEFIFDEEAQRPNIKAYLANCFSNYED